MDAEEILKKFADGTATESDRLELNRLMASYSKEDFASLLDRYQQELLKRRDFVADENSLSELWSKIERESNQALPVRRIWIKRIAVAAVFFLTVAGGVYYWLNSRSIAPSEQIAELQDIEPGREGAVLTLADGRQIVLDSVGNGLVANQNDVQVVLNNGELTYSNGKNSDHGKLIWNTMSTPAGRQFKLYLPDGSKVWLNAESSIRFPAKFAASERRVIITGEVYFDVAAQTSPFFVNLPDESEVAVLGTEFNINAYGDEVQLRTTLVNGAVKISVAGKSVILKPGQQASVSGGVPTVLEVPVEQVISWKNGAFDFNQKTIPEVMRQIARWYDLEVVYEGEIPNRVFWGEVGMNLKLSQCLRILEQMDVRFRLEGRKLVVTP